MGRNYFYNLCISLVNVLFPIVTFRYAAHILGPAGIGKVQVAISFAEYFALFAALGIPVYGIAATAKSNQNKAALSKIFAELISLHALAGVSLSILYFSIIYTVPFFEADRSLYTASGLIILLGFSSIDWFYFGIEKFKLIALRSILVKIIALVLLFLFVNTAADFLNYLYIVLFTILGNNLISLLFVGRHTKLTFKGVGIKKHLRPVLFILGSNVAINMYALWDTLIIRYLSDDIAVGLYTASIKVMKFSIPVIIAFGASLIPRLTFNFHNNDLAENKLLLGKTFHFLILIAVPVSMGMYLLAPEFIFLLSGPEFSDAVDAMRILSFLPLLIGMGHFLSMQIMIPSGMNKQMFFATIVAAITSVGLNFLLIPVFGIEGAGMANIAAETIVTLIFYYCVVKAFKLDLKWSLLPKALVSSLVIIPIVYCLRVYVDHNTLLLFFAIFVCAACYMLLQLFVFKDQLILEIIATIKTKMSAFRNGTASNHE